MAPEIWARDRILDMKIGIIGSGRVGRALGQRLLLKGRPVQYGSRHPHSQQAKELHKQQHVPVKPVANVVDWADIVILAVPGMRDASAVSECANLLGPGIAGKILVDATNPLTEYPGLEVLWNGTSGGELLQAGLPDSQVFKAFNSLGTPLMQQPDVLEARPISMLFAGPPGPSRDAVSALISDVGFEPCYAGPIRYSRNLEAMAELWIHMSLPNVGFTEQQLGLFAFQVVKKQAI